MQDISCQETKKPVFQNQISLWWQTKVCNQMRAYSHASCAARAICALHALLVRASLRFARCNVNAFKKEKKCGEDRKKESFCGKFFTLFCLKKYDKTVLIWFVGIPKNFQLNMFIFEASGSLQILLQSLNWNANPKLAFLYRWFSIICLGTPWVL